MNRQEQLKLVREKCIEANPEIREHHNRCMTCGYGFAFCTCTPQRTEWYLDRPIRLADVLLATTNLRGLSHGDLPVFWVEVISNYDLRRDDLTEQSGECINFLADLLRGHEEKN